LLVEPILLNKHVMVAITTDKGREACVMTSVQVLSSDE